MTDPTVKSVNFPEYKTGIKETWLQGYFDWGLEALETWINERARAGNDDFVELADKNWQSAINQMYENDVDKFEHDDSVRIVGVIDDGSFVGGIYVDILDDATAKINRLWIPESYRGQGYGKELAKRAVAIADHRDVDIIRLSTGPYMQSARAVYEDLGFEYRDEPYPSSTAPEALLPYWNFMELAL